jgi:hypothetical protein
MTDPAPPSRFMVRRGTGPDNWMVWDRQTRGPAKLQSGWATELSEERARQILERLTTNERSGSDQS